MQLDPEKEISRFVDLVTNCRDSGIRVFDEWVKGDPKLLKKSDPEFYACLQSLTASEIEKFKVLLPMIIGTSYYSLFEALEIGKEGLEFQLIMKDLGSETECSLIDETKDRTIRDKVDVR